MVRRSFDIFDTVLTRASGSPSSVFRLCARRLPALTGHQVDVEVYVAARVQAARDVALTGSDTGLAEVHRVLARRLGLPVDAAATTLQLEVDVEVEVSRLVPGARALVDRARSSSGQPLLFLSDTPMPEAVLVRLLEAQGLLQPHDTVLGSAERGQSKEGGGLFPLAAAALGLTTMPLHTGDDPLADVARARLAGWTAVHRPACRPTRYEELLETDPASTGGLGSALSGAGRLARLQGYERGVPQALADVAAGVGAPLLIGYGLWLLQQAESAGLGRLYFCSRDGEVLLHVTRALAVHLGVDVHCSYLYGSSAAWQLPAVAVGDGDLLSSELLRRDRSHRTAEQFLARTGLTVAEAGECSDLPWFRQPECGRLLAPQQQEQVAAAMARGALGELVRARALDQHALLVRYLDQEGVLDVSQPAAVVDVGWLGRVSRALDDVVEHAVPQRGLQYFYVGLFRGSSAVAGRAMAPRQRAWLFDEDRHFPWPTGLPDLGLLVETFTAAAHGRTLGYRDDRGTVVPVLGAASDTLQTWGLAQVREVYGDVVGRLLEDATAVLQQPVDLRPPVVRVLRAFWSRPSPAEARAWGDMPFDLDRAGGASATLGLPLSLSAVRAMSALEGRLAVRPAQSWRQGGITASTAPWRALALGAKVVTGARSRLAALPDRAARARALRRG